MSARRSSISPARSIAVHAVLIAVAVGLLGLAVWSNRDQVREVTGRTPDLRLVAAAFALLMLGLVLTFLRWFVLVRALDLPFRVRDAMRLGFIGYVFNLVIPGAVGGDVVKAAFLCREQARKAQAVATMVLDRILGLLGLFLLAGLSGALAWSTAPTDVRRLIGVVWGAAASGVIGLVVLFSPSRLGPLQRLADGVGKPAAIVRELVATGASYRRRLPTVLAMLALAVVIHALFVLAFYVMGRALFPEGIPSLPAHLLMVPLTLFTTAIPLPFGALGLSEQIGDQLFHLVHHPSGAVAMMGYRVLMYAGGLVGLVVYLANARQVRALRSEGKGENDPAAPSDRAGTRTLATPGRPI